MSVVVAAAGWVAVAVIFDQSRAARSNLRFYACCSPRNFVSLGGQWNFAVVVGDAVGVAVAVRLTRAVRLARISRWLVSVVTTNSSVAVRLGTARRRLQQRMGVAVAVRLTRAVRLARISVLACCRSNHNFVFQSECPSWLAKRYGLRSLCA